MSDSRPSKLAEEALRVANDALELSRKQDADIYAAKKMGYDALNKMNTHEEVCALRALQTLDKVEVLDTKIDKLISVLLGAAKIATTAALTGAVGLIVWLIQTSGAM